MSSPSLSASAGRLREGCEGFAAEGSDVEGPAAGSGRATCALRSLDAAIVCIRCAQISLSQGLRMCTMLVCLFLASHA